MLERLTQFQTPALVPSGAPPESPPDFAQAYDELFPFVWRTLRRLGVEPSAQDDACQEVFVVVHRRLADFRGESSLKTWAFGIVTHVVQTHRRTQRRKDPAIRSGAPLVDPEQLSAPPTADPHEVAVRNERAQIAEELLNSLDEDKRVMLIMADLEGLAITDIATLTQTNLNTTHARLRAARKAFAEAVRRYHARTAGARG